jgi:hypothetical protein
MLYELFTATCELFLIEYRGGRYRRKNLRNSTIFSWITSCANIDEFCWGFYLKLLCVRHEWRHFQDWISQIYSDQLLFDCVWWSIKFYAFWWFTSFKPIVKLLVKLKNCLTYDVISNAYAFFIFWTKQIIFVSISPKFFGDIAPPCS